MSDQVFVILRYSPYIELCFEIHEKYLGFALSSLSECYQYDGRCLVNTFTTLDWVATELIPYEKGRGSGQHLEYDTVTFAAAIVRHTASLFEGNQQAVAWCSIRKASLASSTIAHSSTNVSLLSDQEKLQSQIIHSTEMGCSLGLSLCDMLWWEPRAFTWNADSQCTSARRLRPPFRLLC